MIEMEVILHLKLNTGRYKNIENFNFEKYENDNSHESMFILS